MFPLGLSIVRVENYENWSWFLGLLVQDLEISDSNSWCAMTDNKNQGLHILGLIKKDPKTWCRAHFRCGLDCDILVNNTCESFNVVILKARSLPIMAML
ncbi:unnamed protein product [Coffea canephora]|uniref:DH200=94 genomic scaffold, scaffold_88 n=1 Tax=Coffea canephora TaxID=49390 RepID=A0A068V3Y3_COFCA|nr:unnamed protein product [Coffea canephora]